MGLTGLLFLLFFATGCLLALVRHPIFGALTYVAMVFLDPHSRWWGQDLPDLRWSLVSALVTLIAVVVLRPEAPAIPIPRHRAYILILVLLAWACIQLPWVLDLKAHESFLNYYFKYVAAIYLMYRCVDSEQHFRWLLWAYVLGCMYLALVAYTSYTGGRFDSFGGSGIGDANAGALTLATGIFIAAALFLSSGPRARLALFVIVPFLTNSLIMTASRSGFLALAVGGLTFIWFTPPKLKARVAALSALGVVGFLLLTNQFFWERMQTVKYGGAEVQGVDTGGARRNLLTVQVVLFREHPFGCGHLCTEYLSPRYLDQKDLNTATGRRASHNTFMSMLVDHGIVGGVVYIATLIWIYQSLRRLRRYGSQLQPFIAMQMPGIAGCLAALTISDQFVPNVKYELRYWLLTILMLMLSFAVRQGSTPATDGATPAVGAITR